MRPQTRATTPEQDAAIVAAYVRGDPLPAICADHGVSLATLMRRVRLAGVERRTGRRGRRPITSPAEDAAIAADYAAGMGRLDIERKYYVSHTVIRRACLAHGVPLRATGRPRREGA